MLMNLKQRKKQINWHKNELKHKTHDISLCLIDKRPI